MTTRRQTTQPSRTTGATGPGSGVLAIRWFCPVSAHGRVTRLLAARLLLGRAEECDVVLEGAEASRHHAEIVREGPLYAVADLASTNGVFVDGVQTQRAPIGPGSVLRLGDWLGLCVTLSEPDIPPASELAPRLIGGATLERALSHARRAARSQLPVVIEGETGSGKERVARAIHDWSGRRGSFLAINCAALPEGLAEGELFGYRRGAFTGADRANPGLFRSAHGGTLLLDEVSDMPIALQVKLLRVLEEGEVLPLGSGEPVAVDVRVLAASQEPLERAVADGHFRADLHARLQGLVVRLPPLRERIEDVPGLFSSFLRDYCGGDTPRCPARFVEQLCLYDWPYNVRELELLAQRLATLHGHEPELKRAHLPPRMRPEAQAPSPAVPAATSRDERELEALLAQLRACHGNLARAATAVGISRQRAYRLLGSEGIDLAQLRKGSPPEGGAS